MVDITIMKKAMTADEETLQQIEKTQKAALDITRKYLEQPIREMEAARLDGQEIASAFIMMAYHVLRQNRPEPVADDAFDVLSYFGKRKLEQYRKAAKQAKLN